MGLHFSVYRAERSVSHCCLTSCMPIGYAFEFPLGPFPPIVTLKNSNISIRSQVEAELCVWTFQKGLGGSFDQSFNALSGFVQVVGTIIHACSQISLLFQVTYFKTL